MTQSQSTQSPFSLDRPDRGAKRAVSVIVNPAIERALALTGLNKLYRRVNAIEKDIPFVEKVLEAMAVRVKVDPDELKRIPQQGPLLVVSNHPFGALDGVTLMSILARVRPDDARTMANFILGRIEELRPHLILVDPFNAKASHTRNLAPLKQALRHLKTGGALGMFPAGEVAHFEFANRGIIDPPWTNMVGRLAQRTNATVVPVYFHGTNSPFFHLMGLVHPRLRTAMLAREMLKKNRATLSVRIGKPITPDRLANLEDDQAVTTYCRARCDMLAARDTKPKTQKENDKSSLAIQSLQPIADPIDPAIIQKEIDALPTEDLLLEASGQQIFCTTAANIPHTLKEIGRLREVAFRNVGEGSGNPLDLDRYDQFYHQLFIWKPDTQQIVGGYRLGLTDQLVQRYGMKGLYTHTLFKFDFKLLKQIDPAIELGRSFVAPEFQRSYTPLLNLWKGVCTYVYLNPQYCRLIGLVSISNDYHDVSRRLLIAFLRANNFAPQLARLCRARNPLRKKGRKVKRFEATTTYCIDDLSEVNEVIDDIESQPRGVPILIKQYLRMGAEFLGCNLDPDFGDALDAFMMADLRKTDPRILAKYMGEEHLREFLAYHDIELE